MYHFDSAQRALIMVLEPLGNTMVVEPVAALAIVDVVVVSQSPFLSLHLFGGALQSRHCVSNLVFFQANTAALSL